MALNGGTLNYLGGAGVASTETLGTVLFNAGHSTIKSTAGAGGSVVLTAAPKAGSETEQHPTTLTVVVDNRHQTPEQTVD